MAERSTTRDVVIAGGALAVLFLLFRGSGWGLDGSGGSSRSGDGWLGFGDSTLHSLLWIHVRGPAPRGENFFVGSTVADAKSRAGMTLAAAVEQARKLGARVNVHATGDARQGDVDELQRQLASAGLSVYVS